MTIPAIAPAERVDEVAGFPDSLYILKELMDQYVSAKAVGLFMTNEMQLAGHPRVVYVGVALDGISICPPRSGPNVGQKAH